MTALISTLVGAASSALATLVPNGRSASATGEGAEADFNQLLSTALEGQQGTAAVAGALAQDAAPTEDGAAGATAEGADGEALATALGIAGAVGAELAGRNVAATAAATTAAAATANATTAEAAASAAGASAAGAAAEAVTAEVVAELAAPIDPRRVQRGLGQLNGEFRGRLERVIERMESEFGHRVQVVETVRPQERQDFLFAQGRTRPGPVVTWTRDSNHTEGRAADLLIDGSYENAIAFRRLARIAQEEGLRTLGARDPGHIELPGSGGGHFHAAESRGVGASPTASLAADAQPGVARVAEVAQVAAVAQPRVAQVARVAVPGAPVASISTTAVPQQRPAAFGASLADATLPSTSAAPAPAAVLEASVAAVDARLAGAAASAPVAEAVIDAGGRPLADPTPRPTPAPAAVPSEAGAARTELASVAVHREREVTESAETGARAEAAAETAGREAAPPVAAAEQGSPRAQQAAGAREVAPVFGADAAERVARVLQIQDGAAARPMSQMVLRIDTPDGGVDTIRVDVRGGSVGASIRTSDAGIAEQMTARIGDLQRALESQGLEAEVLQVQTTTPGGASDGVRAVTVSDVAGGRSGPDAGAQNSDRDEPAQRESLFRDRDEDGDAPRQQQRGRRDPSQGRDR